ncbi:MAG: NRDE family protein [Natronospirillum sp.]
MCTLSWQHHQGALNIVFSRDERCSRIEAEPPSVFNEGGRKILAPRDPEGDGFWLATNDHGLTICLLNDYAAEQQHRTTTATQSRGRLVRALSTCATPMAVRLQLQNTAPMDFAPCVVFVFWQTQEPLCWRWSEQAWSETVAPSSPFSTSSLLPQWIPLLRQYFFLPWSTQREGWRTWTPERRFPAQVLQRLGVSAQVPDGAMLPAVAARPVFIANHPTGGLDGLILLAWLQSYYPEVKVVVTDLLTLIPPMKSLVVPVDRYRSSRQSVRNLHAAFATDAAILVFPAGRTARKQQGKLTDFEWHSMPVTLARRYGRPLVPIHLEGTNSRLFHGVAALRQRFNVALNLEMALLPRELLKPATRTFGVSTGEAITVEELEQLAPNDQQRMAAVRAHYDRLTRPHPAPAQSMSSLVLKETSS